MRSSDSFLDDMDTYAILQCCTKELMSPVFENVPSSALVQNSLLLCNYLTVVSCPTVYRFKLCGGCKDTIRALLFHREMRSLIPIP
uniref:Uncharacterized protein n=1 Tax=Parascaris univalens TaxID=6257 RepID=A0A915C6N2_PARUN